MPSPTAVARGVVVDPSAPTAPPPAPLAPPRAPAAGDPVPGDVGAVVARDGVVHFEERSGTTTEVATPAQLGRVLKHEIKDWIDDPYLYQGRLGDDRRPKAGRWVSQPVSPRALPGDRDFGRDQIEVPLISGTFDVSGDAAHGPAQDPDLYKKQVFLERTRDRRAGMASGERAHLSDEAVYALSQRLAAVWDDARRSPAERRRILFRLWDECEEAGAGAAARATILGFIRRRIPAGSPDAYTPADIDELNRGRTSAAPFAPYAR
jgi:hypothetical protein